MATNIRNIEPSDYRKGAVELLAQLTSIDKTGVTEEKFRVYVETLTQNPFHKTVVVEATGQIVGIGTVYIEPKLIHNMGYVGHIEDIVTDKEYRNQHIGKAIITHLSDYARMMGCYKTILDCAENNVCFYEKCGYKKHGIEMSQYYYHN